MDTGPTDGLPDSGDGRPPPAPEALPRPALWSAAAPGRPSRPFEGQAEADADVPARTRGRVLATWGAVGVMLLGVVLLGVAAVLVSWPLAAVGVVVGLLGVIAARRARVLLAVSIGQSPTGPA